MREDNLIGLIEKNATEIPGNVAMREKRYGVWSPMTWLEFRNNVQRFALDLKDNPPSMTPPATVAEPFTKFLRVNECFSFIIYFFYR